MMLEIKKNMTEMNEMMMDMKEDMMMSDMEWKETNSLAGLFQKIVEDCKVRKPNVRVISDIAHFVLKHPVAIDESYKVKVVYKIKHKKNSESEICLF